MLIYIDTLNGSWGIGEDNLAFIEMTYAEATALTEMSDSQIIDYGLSHRHSQ
jgi:hypothetical protein